MDTPECNTCKNHASMSTCMQGFPTLLLNYPFATIYFTLTTSPWPNLCHYFLLFMSAVVNNIFEKWLLDFVSFGNPCTCMYLHSMYLHDCIVHTQQEKVIAEIKTNSNNPHDLVTVQFLEALHNIFERGLLSKERVFTNEADPLCCMQTGLSFMSWCDECIKEGMTMILCKSVLSCVYPI